MGWGATECSTCDRIHTESEPPRRAARTRDPLEHGQRRTHLPGHRRPAPPHRTPRFLARRTRGAPRRLGLLATGRTLHMEIMGRLRRRPGASSGRRGSGAPTHPARCGRSTDFGPRPVFIFGRESRGLPPELRERHRDRLVSIPMVDQVGRAGVRSLNLSTAIAVAAYEVLRRRASAGALDRSPDTISSMNSAFLRAVGAGFLLGAAGAGTPIACLHVMANPGGPVGDAAILGLVCALFYGGWLGGFVAVVGIVGRLQKKRKDSGEGGLAGGIALFVWLFGCGYFLHGLTYDQLPDGLEPTRWMMAGFVVGDRRRRVARRGGAWMDPRSNPARPERRARRHTRGTHATRRVGSSCRRRSHGPVRPRRSHRPRALSRPTCQQPLAPHHRSPPAPLSPLPPAPNASILGSQRRPRRSRRCRLARPSAASRSRPAAPFRAPRRGRRLGTSGDDSGLQLSGDLGLDLLGQASRGPPDPRLLPRHLPGHAASASSRSTGSI